MKALSYHPGAEVEYDEAIGFYSDIDIDLGVRCRVALEAARARLRDAPKSFVMDPDTGCQECAVKKFPYSFHYLELDEIIWIVALAHHRRKPGYWHYRLHDVG
jgi:toxin ParE1/3/4